MVGGMTQKPHASVTNPARYQAYLLRIWREHETAAWRVVVVDVPTGEQHRFRELPEALAFIEQCAADSRPFTAG